MTNTHSYWVKATDWHDIAGRGKVVLVSAPWERHTVGDIVTIYTQGVGEASHLETANQTANHWTVKPRTTGRSSGRRVRSGPR